jgi:hypothetical protein
VNNSEKPSKKEILDALENFYRAYERDAQFEYGSQTPWRPEDSGEAAVIAAHDILKRAGRL